VASAESSWPAIQRSKRMPAGAAAAAIASGAVASWNVRGSVSLG
jgi:hypothetical protein